MNKKVIIKPLPFKVGDKALVHAAVVNSYGYTDALPSSLTGDDLVGKEVVIERVDFYDDPRSYPDVLVRTPEGFPTFIDICFLTKPNVKPVTKRAGAIKKMSPQCKLILNHLKSGNTITQRSALLDFGVMALPRRIADLKDHHNVNVISTMEYNKLTGQRYARYSLGQEKVAA